MGLFEEEPKRAVAVKERANGNESVGTEWVEVRTFNLDTPIGEVLKWQKEHNGRLMIAYDSNNQ